MNDLDDLMARMEIINAKDPDSLFPSDIDTIIAYHRQQRARKASGEKPIRPKAGSASGSSLLDLMSKRTSKPEVKLTRRV